MSVACRFLNFVSVRRTVGRVALPSLIDAEVRYVGADFEPVVTTLASVDVESVVRGRPVRRVRSSAGQRHYSGLYWSTTTRSHLGYESRLELDRLVLADFDRDVDWIATQPMWLSGRDESISRRHVPDLLLKQRGGRYLLVDVKPAEFAGRPEVAAVFAWTGRLCADRGWGYEVWCGAAPQVLENLRFIAQGRRGEFLDPDALRVVRQVVAAGMTVGEAETAAARSGAFRTSIRPALLSVLWDGEWSVDLRRPLSSESVIQTAVAV